MLSNSTFQPSGQRKVNETFRFHCCVNARGRNRSACRAVLCGYCFDKMTQGGVTEANGRRRSARSVLNEQTGDHGNAYKKDANGCCHGDPGQFQVDTNKIYFDKKWRSRQDPDKLLSETCLECGDRIIDTRDSQ